MGSTGTESAAGASASHERRNVSDVMGVLLLGACAAWSLITAAARGGRPEGVLLAVLAVGDEVDAADKQRLVDYLTDNGATTSLDLFDYDVRNNKLHGLFALALQLPAYQLH